MVKTRMLILRITIEQEQILVARAKASGFTKKSEYARTILFKE